MLATLSLIKFLCCTTPRLLLIYILCGLHCACLCRSLSTPPPAYPVSYLRSLSPTLFLVYAVPYLHYILPTLSLL